MIFNSFLQPKKGSLLITVLVVTAIFLIIAIGTLSIGIFDYKINQRKKASAQALHIAEAGVNYYRWVLYHEKDEYCNNETCAVPPDYGPYGPYEYEDSAGKEIKGYYELYILPPALNGSSVVTVRSVGWTAKYPNIKREIEVKCGIPSWSTYSVLANSDIRFGEGTEIWGPIHSNGGIRFDGVAHNLVTSSLSDYSDPDHGGLNEFGVHTHIPQDPYPDGNNPPQNVPDKPAVFMAGRSFPEPRISFDLLNNYANDVYGLATSSGIVLDPNNPADPYSLDVARNCIDSWCSEGFHITFKPDNTFEVRGVSRTWNSCGSKSNSIRTETDPITTLPIPANGLIFAKNTVWVDGQINGARATVVAFKKPFSSGDADIIVNKDLQYTNYDGTDAFGLVAQNAIKVGQDSEDNLRIDAALVAKDGNIGRDHYPPGCSRSIREEITVYGSIATNQRYGFAWTDNTGYRTRNLIYDNNLTFGPPPHFPTTGEYTFISWKET